MTAPPGSARALSTTEPAGSRESRESGFLHPRIVAREAVKVLADLGLDVRPAAVRVLVSRFIAEGHTTTDDLRSWVIAYADPTGETAVRNVMRADR